MSLPWPGPPPIGDVDGIRRKAHEFLGHARQLAESAERVWAEYDRMDFEGPAADADRHQLDSLRRRAHALASELEQLANSLIGGAAHLVDQLHDYEQRLEAWKNQK
jgi:hypothetical protein